MPITKSVVLITSRDPKLQEKGTFGTGFVVHRSDEATYVLTCAHVVRDVGGKDTVLAGGITASVVVSGADRGFDLAVLRVERCLDVPVLELSISGRAGTPFIVAGCYQFDGKQTRLVREIKGVLGKKKINILSTDGKDRIEAWDLKVEGKDVLHAGYSGSPVVDKARGAVVAIVSHLVGKGDNGLGIAIESLKKIWPEMPLNLIQKDVSPIERAIDMGKDALKFFKQSWSQVPSINLRQKTLKKPRVVGLPALPSLDHLKVWKGRDELLADLKAKLLHPENQPKVLAIIGQGGIGKSSLAVKLLEALGVNVARTSPTSRTPRISSTPLTKQVDSCPYECVIVFKAQEGTSFDNVAAFLLDGLGIETSETLITADQKIDRIIKGLAETRCLLVLDELERILQKAGDPQPGRAVSPDLGKLLNALVYQQHQSQTILTSREVPKDLGDTRDEGADPDTELVQIEMLEGVETQAGIEILQKWGLTDTIEDLQWISERVDGNVFFLRQLAAIGKDKPRYLRKHPELVTKKVEFILREQLARQSDAAQDLLRQTCVLRMKIDVRGLTFLRLYRNDDSRFKQAELEKTPEFTQEEIGETQAILERLVDSSLVQRRYDHEKCELFYGLHRLIVEFLRAQCRDERPKLIEGVYTFYRSTIKNEEKPKTLNDLRPVLEAQEFAVQLGKYSEAFSLLHGTLYQYLYAWGSWTLLNELYEHILPQLEDPTQRQIALQVMGTISRYTGKWKEAERCFKESLEIAQKEDSKEGMADSLASLGYIEQYRGNWDEAERLYRQCLEIQTELGDDLGMASTGTWLANIERYRGNWDEAERQLQQSLEVQIKLGDRSGMALTRGFLGYIEQNRGNWEEAERLYRQSLPVQTELGDRSEMARFRAFLGSLELKRGNLKEAEELLRQSLEVTTELGDRPFIAKLIAGLGELERCKGNLDVAEKFLTDALELLEELGEKWFIASAHFRLAQVWQKRGNAELAQQHYNTAHQIFQELGAAKDLERIEQEWHNTDLSHP
jgi:tetratricopeptide (TPR) repeat protein